MFFHLSPRNFHRSFFVALCRNPAEQTSWVRRRGFTERTGHLNISQHSARTSPMRQWAMPRPKPQLELALAHFPSASPRHGREGYQPPSGGDRCTLLISHRRNRAAGRYAGGIWELRGGRCTPFNTGKNILDAHVSKVHTSDGEESEDDGQGEDGCLSSHRGQSQSRTRKFRGEGRQRTRSGRWRSVFRPRSSRSTSGLLDTSALALGTYLKLNSCSWGSR